MRRILLAATAIVGCAVVCLGQAYYEASGQTMVFTLAAGAKSGAAAVVYSPISNTGMNSGITVTKTRAGIVVILPVLQRGNADITLYNIAGRQVYRQRGYSGRTFRLDTRTFAPGVYSMLVRADGKSYSRRVTVSGRGE